MWEKCILPLFLLITSVTSQFFPSVYPRLPLITNGESCGDPLILTPYLKKGLIESAQNISRVSFTETFNLKKFRSHSGFFTVNEKYYSNLFFWYFPPFNENDSAPVILWLQGGPGATSLFGLFTEIGPLAVEDGKIVIRKHHWVSQYHVIFIDNPVGTGFSFTNDNGYCKDENCIAEGLYNALTQFFQLFPKLASNEFYIAGESYAGKFIPSLANEIHNRNAENKDSLINLQGLALGNAYCDPINQLGYGKYLYQHGLIDDIQLKNFEDYQEKIIDAINKSDWILGDMLIGKLMDASLNKFSYFSSYTGFHYIYNILQTTDNLNITTFALLLNNTEIRKSIHVGNSPFSTGEMTQLNLLYDVLKSEAAIIGKLLSHYRMMFYSGQLDIVVAYPLTENFLRKLNFSSAEEYKAAQRKIWHSDGDVAGYIKTAGNLTEVLVRNAGHMVPHDQPKWTFELITAFINKNIDNLC